MTDKTDELIEAAKALLPHLESSTDKHQGFGDLMLPRVERLRKEAADLEAKDAAIKRFRAAVAAF